MDRPAAPVALSRPAAWLPLPRHGMPPLQATHFRAAPGAATVAPRLLARPSDIRWGARGEGWADLHQIVERDAEAARDISLAHGRIGAVLPHVGWHAASALRHVALFEHGRPQAFAVAAAQLVSRDGEDDCCVNLSYLVHADWRGRGAGHLATLGALFSLAQAMCHFDDERLHADFVEAMCMAQCAEDNPAGQALASRLGLVRDEALGFTVPDTPAARACNCVGLRYQGFAAATVEMLHRAWQLLLQPQALAVEGAPTAEMIVAQREKLLLASARSESRQERQSRSLRARD